MLRPLAIGLTVLSMLHASPGRAEPPANLVVHDEVLHTIDPRLFGQFLERASFGEPGPEAFVDRDTGRLPAHVREMLHAMDVPVVRFPGGSDVDYIDWRDMIDNVPGRDGPRPVTTGFSGRTITNHFGYDEYFALRDDMRWETILVVNLLDGLAKKRPLDDAAQLAAGLVAYANAPRHATLPEGMPDWPAVRSANGHAEPFGIQYVQIGNEMWLGRVRDAVREATGLDGEELAHWYVEVYTAYIRAIRAVDPDLPIIIDQWSAPGQWRIVLENPYIREHVQYVAHHKYAPGPSDQLSRDGEQLDPDALSDEQWWWAWATMPGEYDDAGQNIAFGPELDAATALGYEIAATEWNWNGWRWQGAGTTFDAPAAAGIGAAGWVQGMMRQGAQIRMANQSTLLGVGWPIAAIHGDREGVGEPFYNPQGAATTFYRHRHGPNRLRAELTGVPTQPQPYRVGWGPPIERAAMLDVLVTSDDDTIYIHAINRSFTDDHDLTLDLTALGRIADTAVHHTFTCTLNAEPGHGVAKGMVQVREQVIPMAARSVITLPRRSASIVAVDRN